jgi:hypothetical protein
MVDFELSEAVVAEATEVTISKPNHDLLIEHA